MHWDYDSQFIATCLCVLFGARLNAASDEFGLYQSGSGEWHQREARVAVKTVQETNTLSCNRSNIYVCEEPPDIIPLPTAKSCNYRNTNYHEQIYKWVAGRGCLLFTPDFLFQAGYNDMNLSAACWYEGMIAPCLEIAKEDGTCGCYPYDPGFEEVSNAVREAVVPGSLGRWESCFYTASDCCSHYMNEKSTDENNCETTFDGWTCWHEAEANTIAYEVCSEFAYSNAGPTCHHHSSKECFANGTWEAQTDYSTCSVTPRLLQRYNFHVYVLAISIATCLPAVFIFFFYKRLRVTRVAMHRNLLIAIIIRNVLVIVSRQTIYIAELTSTGDTVMSTHGVACRVLGLAERAAVNFVFVAMLVEGIYLHRMIVAVFRTKINVKWLYGIGVVIALIPVTIWAILMGVLNDHSCWIIYTVENVQWALDAPRMAILLINNILFLDILRVLLTKLRNSENANQLSTTKATLFLMPIFGTQFFLTAFRPNTTNCAGEQIYYYVSYAMEALQGFVVALLYCYVNKEVRGLIKQTYRKTENAVVSRVRNDSSNRPSMGHLDRRLTYSTALPSHNEEENKNQYATIRPRLHVAEIISIQASERLADILEPVYETIQTGVVNEGYDSLERSEISSSYVPSRCTKPDDYYGFTQASSISIECQDWIRGVSSPSSSIYNNSLNDYEARYLERKFGNHPKLQEINEAREKMAEDKNSSEKEITPTVHSIVDQQEERAMKNSIDSEMDSEMLDEILQYMENNDVVVLNPVLLSPNRDEDDQIIFVEDDNSNKDK